MYDHDRYYYDKAGNLLDNEGQGPVMNNRLPGCGRDRYGYNEWGELTTRRYPATGVERAGAADAGHHGNTETHYGYDALGRRIRKATYGTIQVRRGALLSTLCGGAVAVAENAAAGLADISVPMCSRAVNAGGERDVAATGRCGTSHGRDGTPCGVR